MDGNYSEDHERTDESRHAGSGANGCACLRGRLKVGVSRGLGQLPAGLAELAEPEPPVRSSGAGAGLGWSQSW
jgi:hypothetical protein